MLGSLIHDTVPDHKELTLQEISCNKDVILEETYAWAIVDAQHKNGQFGLEKRILDGVAYWLVQRNFLTSPYSNFNISYFQSNLHSAALHVVRES